MEAKFILSRKKVFEQYNSVNNLGVNISYSYKTNREVGNVLQETDCWFSIHNMAEMDMIKDKGKIFFFSQAWNQGEIREIAEKGVRNFVIDNEVDLKKLLEFVYNSKIKVNILLRMKFQEHRIESGKYFVYGMPARKINELIDDIKGNPFIEKIGIHVHRKSQNTSEWEIKEELKESITEASLKRINFVNIGGGLPVKYRSYSTDALPYIFNKIKEAKDWLQEQGIETFIEPGRFIAAPSVMLQAEIIQVYNNIIVLNVSIFNCALDTILTNTKMLVENELDDNSKDGEFYLIKGNSPSKEDIFRYKVRLLEPKVGDKIVFLNAGAYNYTTDFCDFKKLKTEIVEDF